MGSSSEHRPKGQSVLDTLTAVLGPQYEVVESAIYLTEAYLAIRDRENQEVMGVVVKIQHTRDHWNFTTKWMDETMGPYGWNAPRRVMEALTDPAPGEYATEWRRLCWEAIHKRESQPKVRVGDTVKFTSSIKFTNGHEGNTFRFVKRSTFQHLLGYQTYSIPRWRDLEYEVVAS